MYEDLNEITIFKILILENGVKLDSEDTFNNLENKTDYKFKFRNKKPLRNEKYQVFDISTDNSVIPEEILISKNNLQSITKLRYNQNSPVTFCYIDNQFKLKYNGKLSKLDINLVKKHKILNEKIPINISKKGKTIGDYISIVGLNRITVLFFDGCYNWHCGKACWFCDLHPKRKNEVVGIPTLNNLCNFGSLNDWWNSQKEEYINCIIYSLKRILGDKKSEKMHLFFMAGNTPLISQVWDIANETIKSIANEIDLSKYNNYLNIAPHDNQDRLTKMKEYGIKQVQYNLEVSDKKIFTKICPGKMDYDLFINQIKDAISIFGNGNVRSNFVLGLEPIIPLLGFLEKMSELGLVADYSIFQPKKCTPLSGHSSPKVEDIINFSQQLVGIYLKHNFKPIFCTLSSRSSIINELYLDKVLKNGRKTKR
ncbi:MAG: hypothetical protein KAQ83_01765 [Nanoarchaeota archaeon]|nr:hypothetical protein [Nanoarchaeota archaeon]